MSAKIQVCAPPCLRLARRAILSVAERESLLALIAHDTSTTSFTSSPRRLVRSANRPCGLVRQEDFTLCSDQDIKIGQNWHQHIQAHLNGARAVVLLISPAFLASDYIANSELPVILKNAADQGVRIFPILISPSVYKRAKYKHPDPKTGPQQFTLASIQAANPPSETLIEMTEGEQNRVLERVADQLADLLNPQ